MAKQLTTVDGFYQFWDRYPRGKQGKQRIHNLLTHFGGKQRRRNNLLWLILGETKGGKTSSSPNYVSVSVDLNLGMLMFIFFEINACNNNNNNSYSFGETFNLKGTPPTPPLFFLTQHIAEVLHFFRTTTSFHYTHMHLYNETILLIS